MDATYQDAFEAVILSEVVPATGCTEPIAIALAAARARAGLGERPQRLALRCSGNIIKNARAVTVPRSGNRVGIEIAAALGALCGVEADELRCLENVTTTQADEAAQYVADGNVTVALAEGVAGLWIEVTATAGEHHCLVLLEGTHTHISRLEVDGDVRLDDPFTPGDSDDEPHDLFSVENILTFADVVDFDEHACLAKVLDKQVEANEVIAQEGLTGDWGAEIGKTLRETRRLDVQVRARSLAAAGSDARMSGCALPVMINSGSGNQGVTVSMPVLEYARELGASTDELRRALIVSNLVAIYQKRLAGRLSAFCGVITAASGAAAGIARLKVLDRSQIGDAIVTTIATSGGVLCDGAKPSCASKISMAVDNATCAVELAERNHHFRGGDGLVADDVETTIRNIGRVAHDGMAATDIEILETMLGHK